MQTARQSLRQSISETPERSRDKAKEEPRKPPRDDGSNLVFLSGQQNWRNRIKKEERVNAKLHGQFSVRTALRSLDIPKLFKPCQVDPEDARQPAKLDPATEHILRADIAAKIATPREYLLWPETSQHDVGWLHGRTGDMPFSERRTFVAPEPKVGFGWPSQFSAGSRPMTRQQGNEKTRDDATGFDALLPDSTRVGRSSPSPRAPKLKDVKAWGPSVGELRRARRLMRNQRRQAEAAAGSLTDRRQTPGPAAAGHQRNAVQTPEPSATVGGGAEGVPSFAPQPCPVVMEPAISSGLWNAVKQHVEDPWLNRNNDVTDELIRPSSTQDEHLATTCRQTRKLTGTKSRWFKPKDSSAISDFADEYRKSWGVCYFSKALKQ